MKTIHNILTKIFLILALGVGWGSSAVMAQGFPVAGKTYSIKAKFANASDDSYLTNGGTQLTFEQNAQNPGSYWIAESSGDSDFRWRFKSVAEPSKYLDANSSTGLADATSSYANFNVIDCGSVSGVFHLNGKIGGGDTRTNLNIGTWGYTHSKTGFGRRGDGAWGTDHSNTNWTTDYEIEEILFLNGTTNIRFIDTNGSSLAQGEVNYTKANGDVVKISTSTYDFDDVACGLSCFKGTFDYSLKNIAYDSESNTLIFTVAYNKWYTMKVKNNGYVSSDYADGSGNLMVNNSTKPTNYAGIWRNVYETAADAQGQGNVTLANAQYYNERQLGMLQGTGDGGNDRAQMYPVASELPTGVSSVFQCKVKSGQEGSYYFTLPGTNRYFNDRNGYLASWENSAAFNVDGSRFVIEEVPTMGEDVTVNVAIPAGVTVKYNTQCEAEGFLAAYDNLKNVTLTDGMHFNFHNMPFLPSLFTFEPADAGEDLTATFDEENQTLTFAVDPNYLHFSPAPTNGEWAENTKWFTWRNNRPEGSGSNPPRRYISTSKYFVNNHMYIGNSCQDDASADRGGVWCFVGDENGFQIQNAAYGPDFVFAYVNNNGSARYEMVLKDELPTGATTTFTYLPCGAAGTGLQSSGYLDGAKYGYVFRIGTAGNNQIHSNSSGLISWNGGYLRYDDGGSVFKVTAVSDDALAALQAYDVYRVNTVGVPGYTDIKYRNGEVGSPASNTFGRRTTAKNGDFLIVEASTTFDPADFNVVPADYDILTVETSDDATHYYKHLELEIHDRLATEAYILIVTNGTADAYDVDAVKVFYYGRHHKNGESVLTFPGVLPNTAEFRLSCEDDKFIWGPVIDTKAKTVTFDIRDRVTTFHTGLYQLMLKGDANITKVNNFIVKYDENINTPSRYLYIAPSIHKEDNTVFKFTGVPTYAEEPTTYIYIEENTDGTVNISAAGGAAFNNLAYTFDATAGEITFTNYGINGYTNKDNQGRPKYEPREMPSFVSGTGPTTYALTPISMTAYDAYRISYGGTYTAQTRVNYGKTTPTGVSNYGLNDLFIVNKGYTSFLPSDFTANDARCTKVEIVSTPTDLLPGELRLTLDLPLREFTVKITGDAKNLTTDRVVYNGADYENDATVSIAGATVDPMSIKTNVTDRFVWGPVIDEDFRTITFDIRPLPESIETGWYQIQLLDDNKIESVNSRIAANNGNINSRGNYIYVLPTYNSTSTVYTSKYGGVPTYAGEASSYYYITRGSGNYINIQTANGLYLRNGTAENGETTVQNIDRWEYNTSNHHFRAKGWTAPGFWEGSGVGNTNYIGNQGPGVATGDQNTYYQEHYITKVDPTTLYDVYKVDLTGTNQTTVRYVGPESNGNPLIYNGGYLFLGKDTEVAAHEFSFGRTMTINSIAVSRDNVITFDVSSVAEGCSNMIIHRQHDVYDRLEAVNNDLLPDDNHIKRGGGMIPQPYAATFTAESYTANDRHMQNTSVFRMTQYVKPGFSTECVLPFAKKKAIENNSGGHTREYQRWYDYTTERCLPDAVIATGSCSADHVYCTLSQYYKFTNGHCNFAVNNGTVTRAHNYLAKADITLPVGQTELYVGVDASEFQDHDVNIGNSNMLEPSLNMRVIFHIISAHEMAKNLTTSGDTWWEDREYIVPNVKRGSDTYRNNADLLPLNMAFCNYWFYKTEGTVGEEQDDAELMPLVAEDGDYDTLRSNLEIVISGTATDGRPMKDYLEVGVLDGNPGGIGTAPYINTNHQLYYKIKGTGVTRTVPAGSQAVIKVYAKDGFQGDTSPRYQLVRFVLDFEPDTDPIAITDVVGNPASTRSVDYFVSKNYEEVANMTFQQKEVPFTKIPNARNNNNEPRTYAFPIDFDRTSYGYSPNYTYANYSITRQGWGIKFQPVALYERNIKNPSITSMDIKDDYFFYIDAAETPGQVAAVKLDGDLCPGSRLFCYGWVGSGNAYDASPNDKPCGASVVLRLLGIKKVTKEVNGVDVETEEEVTLASYLPGMLTDVSYDSKGNAMRSLSYGRTPSMEYAIYMEPDARQVGTWNSIGFSFTLGEAVYDRYEVRILNNCISTSGGDYSLDDFRIFAAPPKARVDYIAPVCYDHVPLTNVVMPRNAVQKKLHDTDGETDISYCFLDKEKYYDKLDELLNAGKQTDENYELTHGDYNIAFNGALIGNGTATDNASQRSFWNVRAAYDDNVYNSYREYNFSKIVSETDGYTVEGVYRQTTGSIEEIVFSTQIAQAEGWEPNRDYLIALSLSHISGPDFSQVGTNNFACHSGKCSALDEFRLKPSLTINSDIPELTVVPAAACEGQVSTISVDMHGYGPLGSVVLKNMAYDWWIGYGKPNATDPAEKADVHNFDQQEFGGVYLRGALEHFRAFYPDAFEVESYAPKTGEVAGQTVTYSDADKACILHFLEPGANGRVPLVLGSRILNVSTVEADAVVEDGQKYIYFTVLPIRPDEAYDADQNVIFCPDPQQGKIKIEEYAPKMIDGFTGMHGMYPAAMTNVPVRMGLRQIDAVRLDAFGNMDEQHLRVPLRGIAKSPSNSSRDNIKIGKRKRRLAATADSDTQSFNDFLTLVYTDDPLYSDRMIQDVDEYGNMQLITVGRVQAYNAPANGDDAHMEIGFARDFRPREGYTYTLKAFFEENYDTDPDAYKSCPGSLIFDLKVVPEYAQWTAAEGNTDWTNDGNWARADRDVLNADNATSERVNKGDAAHPFAGYLTNTANYSSDPRYKVSDDASAHVFTPMYFTNVLMHDAQLRAPEIYTHTAPVAGSSFLGGLEATATKFIEYDMLATPISETGSWSSGKTMTPLALAQRYGNYSTNFGCELFWSNVCDGLTFEPATMMYDAQNLLYNKAWVEYELKTDRWYTLASPLQDTYAGEWYSPEDGGRQLTPHFYAIKYNESLNDRFNPAYYQRSWDKAGEAWIYRMNGDNGQYLGFEHDTQNADVVRVQKPTYLNWSYVYNDVTVPYSQGGFSVNVRYTDGKDATDSQALVRMPKDDASYYYYQSEASAGLNAAEGSGVAQDGSTGGVQKGDDTDITRGTTHHRLMSDLLLDASGKATTISQNILNASPSNPYYLVGNPLMAPLDMDKFFQQNTQFVDNKDDQNPNGDGRKYWIMDNGLQTVSIKVNGNWVSTTADGGMVAPLQGFFVRVASDESGQAEARPANGVQVTYTAAMQKQLTADVTRPSLKAPRRTADAQPGIFRIDATNDGQMHSSAIVYFSEQASNRYNTAEDAETLLDGNIADKVSTVFTAADEQALSINSMSTAVTTIPLGVIAPKDDTRTTLRFSGISQLEAVMEGTPHLYDAANDTFEVLDEETALTVTGTTAGRYFIVCGTSLPFADEAEENAEDEYDGKVYNLHGIRVATPQHGTVTIRGSRKEYSK